MHQCNRNIKHCNVSGRLKLKAKLLPPWTIAEIAVRTVVILTSDKLLNIKR